MNPTLQPKSLDLLLKALFLTPGTDDREPWDDYTQLLTELELYNPTLLNRARLIVANKMDDEAAPEKLKIFRTKIGKVKK